MNVGNKRDIEPNSTTKLADECNQWKEILACSVEGNIFCLHGRNGYFGLEAGMPEDSAPKGKDNISSATAGTVGIVCMFMAVKTSKVGVRVTIHAWDRRQSHDESFVHGAFQVTTDPNECQLMPAGGFEGITSTLVDSKGNVRS